MRDLISRLHRLKLILTTLTLVAGGIALLVVDDLIEPSAGWLDRIPWSELGGIVIGAGLLGIWLDHHFRREQELGSEQRLRRIMHDHAPAMRDAVLEAFAANHADLKRVATPETLDRIATSSLALRLDDPEFAEEIYADIRSQAINAAERWTDATYTIDLAPLERGRRQSEYFVVTVRCEYRTVPAHAQRRFVCLSDRTEYANVIQSGGATSPWFFKPDTHFSAAERDAYELLSFSVNGESRSIRRAARKDSQIYTADVGVETAEARAEVDISYTFRTITRRDGNLLFIDLEQPTKNASFTLDYTGTGIQDVSALDMLPSERSSRIERSPAATPVESVRVETDGWAFPRAGVAFVWRTSHVRSPRGPEHH